MIVAELATCRVPTDPASPTAAGGHVVVCMTFYEGGFGVPSHRFFRVATVLRLRAASLDSFRDLAYSGLCDSM
jgi:hypothetical protein